MDISSAKNWINLCSGGDDMYVRDKIGLTAYPETVKDLAVAYLALQKAGDLEAIDPNTVKGVKMGLHRYHDHYIRAIAPIREVLGMSPIPEVDSSQVTKNKINIAGGKA